MASGSSSNRMGGHEHGGSSMRKGPWMTEEDEILLEYVRKHGPRDWSSIRSKGLLPRTGKSCRLRWVNKLKPDLKTGCKFSPEEERIVINLQGQFGNKWARIATYLPGRTDNDVKNFWSTRQKRLARILRTPLPTKSNKQQGKPPVSSHETASSSEEPCFDLILSEEDSSKSNSSKAPSSNALEDGREFDQLPDLVTCPCLLNIDTPLHLLKPSMQSEPCLMMDTPMPPPHPNQQLPFGHLPQPLLGLPLEPDAVSMLPGHDGVSFTDELAFQEPLQCVLPEELPLFGFEAGFYGEERPPPIAGGFFDEFATEMFDYLESPPPPPPPDSSCQ